MKISKIIAVCISEKKGTKKKVVPEASLKEGFGMIGDAHADSGWHRQVSLLANESIEKMRDAGYNVAPGDFAENLTCDGIDLVSLPIGTKLKIGNDILLRISQIGKECHAGCAIFKLSGKCIMPKEGVFSEVIKGGHVKAGDKVTIQHDID